MIMRSRHMPYIPDDDEDTYSVFQKINANAFFTSGNYISMNGKINGKKVPLVLHYDLKDESGYDDAGMNCQLGRLSTNDHLRSILVTIRKRSSEMQWKLIPVTRIKDSYETLIGYVRCEAAMYYLQAHFESICSSISTKGLFLKDPLEISKIVVKHCASKSFSNCFGRKFLQYNSYGWEQFLAEEINWDEILEEKPCSVTMTTRLPDIQIFVQKNFLPQVFVLDGVVLSGVITRENIIEQVKLLHRQLGTLATSYRSDLQSLPMKTIHPDQIMSSSHKVFSDERSNGNSDFIYTKLRTHSE